MLVSIIIPVYNKQDFLDECIKSVSTQDYDELEIIIVNDGSTDKSEEIIEKWIIHDSRIKYINQSNKGVATARNRGISIAKGDYIFLLDADDLLEENAISKLLKYTKKTKADIVIGNYYERHGETLIKKSNYRKKLISNSELLKIDTKLDMFIINDRPMAMAGNKLYRLDFIRKNKIKFIDNVIAEDRLFNLICYIHNPVIQIAPEYTYIYNVYEDSRSRTVNSNYTNESISLFLYFYSYLKRASLLDLHKDLLHLVLMYDLNKILSYTIRYSERKILDTISALKILKTNSLISNVLPDAVGDKRYRKIKHKSFKRMFYNSYLLLHAPPFLIVYKIFGRLIQNLLRKMGNLNKN